MEVLQYLARAYFKAGKLKEAKMTLLKVSELLCRQSLWNWGDQGHIVASVGPRQKTNLLALFVCSTESRMWTDQCIYMCIYIYRILNNSRLL